MEIAGLQKLTLLDFPGKVACTVFLGGCNFACPFCHNSELIGKAEPVMSGQELLKFLEGRRFLLDGVCITGGEPTLHKELFDLLRQIKALGFSVKLDTNGYRPDILSQILAENLADYVAMDIKNGPAQYAETAGKGNLVLKNIEKSMHLLLSDVVDYEFRTTFVEPLHTEAAVLGLRDWFFALSPGKKAKRWFLQPFVDRDTVVFDELRAPDGEKLRKYQQILTECAEKVQIRGME